jgi:purine-binding chemotaxis protein CheW
MMAEASRAGDAASSGVWVLFEAAGMAYAVPSDRVLGIHDVPVVTPLPFAPDYVDGLIGVPGSVCILIDLPRRLNTGRALRRRAGQAAIRLTADHGSAALRVDRVLRLAEFDRISRHDGEVGALAAVIGTGWSGEQAVTLLDPERLALGDLAPTDFADLASEWVNSAATEIATLEERRLPFVILENQPHFYALPVSEVLEVVPMAPVNALPLAPPAIGGTVMLRGMPLLMVWLDRLLGQEVAPCRDLVIMALGELRFALAVGRVVRLERLPARPQHLATPLHGRLDAYHKLEDGGLAHLLSLSDFLDPAARAAIRGFAPGSYDRRLTGGATVVQKRLLVFRIGSDVCALPLDEVERVAPLTNIVELPADAEGDVDAAVEIGGEIVPVSSLRRLFGAPAGRDANCILVRTKEGATGLGVDAILGLVSVPLSAIEPAGNPRGPIREFTRHGDQLLWILSTQAVAAQALRTAEAPA